MTLNMGEGGSSPTN